MSDERYIDPNSGAAPQPGGWAGPDNYEAGHGSRMPVESEIPDQSGEDHGDDEREDVSEAEAIREQALLTQGVDTEPDDEDDEDEGYEGFPEGDGEVHEDESGGEAVDHQSDQQGVVTPAQVPSLEEDELPSEISQQAGDGNESGDGESKDYSELLSGNVGDVTDYMDEHPDERDAVIQAERDRAAAAEKEPRKGVVGDE